MEGCPTTLKETNLFLTLLTLKAFKLLYYILAFIINTLKDFSNSLKYP